MLPILYKCIYFFIHVCGFLKIIYLFILALGLHCCVQDFSSCVEWGLLFVAVCRLLIAMASLVAETGSRRMGFSSCGMQAQ